MYTNDIIKFMDNIITIITFIESALQMDEIIEFKLTDLGDTITFSIQRGSHNVPCVEIDKIDDDSLKVIYASIAAKYQSNMEIGALSKFKGKDVTWSLAPVIGNNTLVEFISPKEKDQQWFYEEIEKSTMQKGLR